MVLNTGQNGIDFVDILPVEVVEEIFQNLSVRDLVKCSLVSLRWREMVNNNRVWAKLCARENIHDKEPLVTSHSHFHNPTKMFRPVVNTSKRLTDICHWRSHYDRYKFLANNWRKGHCALHRLNITNHVLPVYYNEGILIVVQEREFLIYVTAGEIRKLCEVRFMFRSSVDTVLFSKNLLIYSQMRNIIVMERYDDKFVEAFIIRVDQSDSNTINNSNEKELKLKQTENYLIVLDPTRPSQFYVWNTNTGQLEKEVKIETAKNYHVPICNCIEVFSLKVYVSFNVDNCYFVYEYDLVKSQWGSKFSVPFRVNELYVTRQILCAKLADKRSDDSCDLHMWSLKDKSEVAVISVNDHKPIALTNDVVLYCLNNTINVQSIQTTFQSKFQIPTDMVVDMYVSGNQLVINTGDSVEVWDWGTGEKLYTPYRGICSSSMWVDEKVIIISRWSCNFQIIGFW